MRLRVPVSSPGSDPTPAKGPEGRGSRSQAERHRATHDALLGAGRRLFAADGFAGVSTEQVVAAAGVTRGAMYHHFRDKTDLFRGVYVQLEEQLCAELTERIDAARSVVEGLARGIGWFLDVCERPEVRRIALVDAPAVLGWATWRQVETDYALGVLTERLRAAQSEGVTLPGPVETVASLLFASILDAALSIAYDLDPPAARSRIEPALYGIATRALGLVPQQQESR